MDSTRERERDPPLSLPHSSSSSLFPLSLYFSSFSFLFLFPLSLSSFSFLFLFPLSLSSFFSPPIRIAGSSISTPRSSSSLVRASPSSLEKEEEKVGAKISNSSLFLVVRSRHVTSEWLITRWWTPHLYLSSTGNFSFSFSIGVCIVPSLPALARRTS